MKVMEMWKEVEAQNQIKSLLIRKRADGDWCAPKSWKIFFTQIGTNPQTAANNEKHPKALNKISLFCCCSPKSNLQDCQTPDQIHLARAVFNFMSTAAVARTAGGGGGGGQLGNIKSEGYGSQLAPAGLDCHLAQINREVSHSTEPTRLSENSRLLEKILFIVANGKILRSTPLSASRAQTSSLGARSHNYLPPRYTYFPFGKVSNTNLYLFKCITRYTHFPFMENKNEKPS